MSQTKNFSPRSRGPSYTVGILFMLIGAMIVATAFGILYINPSEIQAPRWVLAVFGFSFMVAGVWSIFQKTVGARGQDDRLKSWINFSFGLLILAAISVICLWAGFGAGEHLFVQEVGIGINPATRPVDPTTGRIFLGGFGVLMSLVTLYYAVSQPRKLLHNQPPEEAGQDNPGSLDGRGHAGG